MSSDASLTAGLAGRMRAATHDRRGVAAIEFAAIIGVIVVIVLGTYDIGNYVLQQMKLAEAAFAGGQDAVSYPPTDVNDAGDPNTAILTAAIQQALPANWTLGADTTLNMSMTCSCGGTELTTERFVTITLTRAYNPLLVAALSSTSATYVVRIQ